MVVALVLLTPAGCGGESACEQYERIGKAADANNESATLQEADEAAKALVECMAEEADPQR